MSMQANSPSVGDQIPAARPVARPVARSATQAITLERLALPEGLFAAWQAVERRGAGPGSDGETVQGFSKSCDSHLAQLEAELRDGRYRPRPAQRFWLVKDSGGERGISIFTVRDRVVLGAIRRVLGRAVAPSLSSASFAYREGLGAVQAAQRLVEHRRAGRAWVVRSDLKDYFDTVAHGLLLEQLQPFVDGQALELLGRILRTPVREGRSVSVPTAGIAQGSPISPLLANLYLSGFDAKLDADGRGFVRFADDFVIAATSASTAGQALEIARAEVEALALRINQDKTKLVSFEQGFDFLGFHFDAQTVRVSDTSQAEFKAHLEALLLSRFESRGSGGFDPRALKQANDLIRGWRNYYRLGTVREDFVRLQEWIEARFGRQADHLESLIPERRGRAPQLGGYGFGGTGRGRASQRGSNQRGSNQRGSNRAGFGKPEFSPIRQIKWPFRSVKIDPNFAPLSVRRAGQVLNVISLSGPAETIALASVLEELEETELFHRANSACRWHTATAADAISALASALNDRRPTPAALEAYNAALFEQIKGDARAAKGSLRAALRRIAWAALLEAGLDLGPMDHKPPRLANALGDAFECLIAEPALIDAARKRQLHAPLEAFVRSLEARVPYVRPGTLDVAHATAWPMVLLLEAQAIRTALTGENLTPYRTWRFGLT